MPKKATKKPKTTTSQKKRGAKNKPAAPKMQGGGLVVPTKPFGKTKPKTIQVLGGGPVGGGGPGGGGPFSQYVLMPVRGTAARGPTASPSATNFLVALSNQPRNQLFGGGPVGGGPGPFAARMKLLDSVHENGAKLVEMHPDECSKMRAEQPGLRIVAVRYFYPAVAPMMAPLSKARKMAVGATTKTRLKFVSSADGNPVVGATVVAFTNFALGEGDQQTTDSKGEVTLSLGGQARLDRLYVYPEIAVWSMLKRGVNVASGLTIPLRALKVSFKDGVRHFYGTAADGVGAGVRVGVIDSGIHLAHPDLSVAGGENTVVGELPGDFGDAGNPHGTHVAGIIAARGKPGVGIRGIAPGVELRSYRVFGRGSNGASNFAIVKAIDRAVADGCDFINMSLGGGDPDDATRAAMEDARAAGCVPIVAAGNDGRSPVSFPALDDTAIAVSATGRKGTFPAGTTESDDVLKPFGTDQQNFLARFSNIGPEIDITGPGVGIISTVPGGYGAMSGTSMACPAVTGAAARLLAANAAILNQPRNQERSNQIIELLLNAAKPLGFGPQFEGRGLP